MKGRSQIITGLALAAALLLAACSQADDGPAPACAAIRYEDTPFTVCSFNPAEDEIRLFLNDQNSAPYGSFDMLRESVEAGGQTLGFAMNAGMYNEARAPIGLYIEAGEIYHRANTNDGPGNFHMKPNGIFWLEDKRAGVTETSAWLALERTPDYATQSGPMLVINGDIHPMLNPDGTSRKRRNGVGVTRQGQVVFAISDTPVTFHDFASLFRDELKTPNALFLDGTVSKIYTPDLDRNETGLDMGPMVGVVR